MAARSSWEGYLKLNLLSIPVKAYSVTVGGRRKIAFHEIHEGCGERIRHQKVCPVHGQVSKDEVVSGYEYSKGEYVLVEDDELSRIRKEDEKSLTIDVFVHPDALDPVYFSGRSLYLVPDGKVGPRPFQVIHQVMKDEERYAVARIVLSGRLQPVLIRPVGGLLAMSVLNYADQVKKPAAFEDDAPKLHLAEEEINLAESLVNAATDDDFNFAQYKDEYETELAEVIEAKIHGRKLPERKTAEQPAVINLMDALRKSLDQTKKQGKRTKEKAKPHHKRAKQKAG